MPSNRACRRAGTPRRRPPRCARELDAGRRPRQQPRFALRSPSGVGPMPSGEGQHGQSSRGRFFDRRGATLENAAPRGRVAAVETSANNEPQARHGPLQHRYHPRGGLERVARGNATALHDVAVGLETRRTRTPRPRQVRPSGIITRTSACRRRPSRSTRSRPRPGSSLMPRSVSILPPHGPQTHVEVARFGKT
jgi:hypothetical protein